jgi:hypothetical protein
MSRNDIQFPWRVTGIAVLLFAALAVVGWLLFGPTGSGSPSGATGVVPSDGTAGGAAAAPAQTSPVPASDPQAVTDEGPEAIDPSTPEGRAALAAARAGSGTMDLQLFLIVPGVERLVPVLRTVAAPSTLDTQVERAVQELIDWVGSGTTSPVAPEASVREVWVSPGGIAYVDFDRAFYDFSGGGSLAELHTVYGVVATLTESFPEIIAVQFLIEGRWIETLAGHVDLSRPLLPSDEWVLIERRQAQIQPSDVPR